MEEGDLPQGRRMMSGDKLPKQWTQQGRRTKGRPTRNWNEGIDKKMEGRDLPEKLWADWEGLQIRHR